MRHDLRLDIIFGARRSVACSSNLACPMDPHLGVQVANLCCHLLLPSLSSAAGAVSSLLRLSSSVALLAELFQQALVVPASLHSPLLLLGVQGGLLGKKVTVSDERQLD